MSDNLSRATKFMTSFSKFIKISLDYILSLLGIIILSPLLIFLWICIYVNDPGPVIFKHMRVGKEGIEFPCYKFRTMVVNSEEVLAKILDSDPEALEEWETTFKLKHDPRVTKLGQFMRKTSLDELPQLLNVLKGEMSLVGPRPVIKEEIANYYVGHEQDYYSVRPGITGLWQVSGRNELSYEERVNLDSWYVQNWSLGLDAKILIKTIAVVIGRRGAY